MIIATENSTTSLLANHITTKKQQLFRAKDTENKSSA